MFELQRLSYAPTTRIHVEAGSYRDHDLTDDLAKILRQMHADRAGGVRTVSVLDLTRARPLNAMQRKHLLAWLKEFDSLVPLVSLGTAFIAPSALLRGVLTAMFWIRPYPVEQAVVSDMDEAMHWVVQRLESSGIAVPARLRQELGRAFAPAAREI